MGCDCCEIDNPKAYEKCRTMRKAKRYYVAPCGNEWGSRNTNMTPKKKKRKKTKRR